MPFQYILANLLAKTGAVGVLFLDEMGETVDVACSDFTPYEMRVLGAYLGIYLRQIGSVLADGGFGSPRRIHVERERLHIHAVALPDEYYLVLVQRQPALVGSAHAHLEKAAAQLAAALFD